MTDLHDSIGAALDREQAQAEDSLRGHEPGEPWGYSHLPDDGSHIAAQNPTRTLRRVEADRRVLARHSVDGWGMCDYCDTACPCPDLLDLAARLDVETDR